MKKTKFLSAVTALGMAFAISASATSYSVDFEEAYTGDNLTYTDMGIEAGWEEHVGLPGSSSFMVYDDGDGNQYIRGEGFIDVRSPIIEEEYVYSLDIRGSEKLVAEGLAGFFVRSSDPNNYSVIHNGDPNTKDWNMKFNFYEADWYQEAGGQNGSSGIGGSGIHIAPMADSLRLVVKKYVEDGTTVSNEAFYVTYPEGVSYDKFANYKFRDNGETIEILLNGEAFVTIELSEPGVVYESDANINNDAYYGKAVIKDATGAELGTVEKTRICSSYSMLAIGVRTCPVDFDNFQLYTGEGVIEADKNGTLAPDEPETEAPATEAPATDAPATEADDTNAATEAVDSAADSAADSTSDDDEKGGLSGGIIAIIAVAVVAVVGVAAVLLKKKK